MVKRETVETACPDCGSALVVDIKTGKVLHHEAKKPESLDFDELLSGLEKTKIRDQKAFDREQAAFADRDRLLEKQFEDALKRAEEAPDEDVIRPFDLD